MNFDLKSPTRTGKKHVTLFFKMSTVISFPKMPTRTFLGLLLAFCFISGITGDVPDGVVYTDLHQNALLGSTAVLKCEFYGAPIAVSWGKGDNPSTSLNLITWVEGEPDSGSCATDKTCEMGDDYSLIIKNVSIADRGRYICRVSNYKGALIHNFTDVKVFALPAEPFPIINECKESQRQNCILLATSPVNITCAVLKYFPNVDLFFLHGIKKYSVIETVEWTNADGTKSKSIFTTAPPSDIPYGCVAFNIPGSQERRTATVTVTGQGDATTAPSSPPVIKIVVPIITAFCVVAGIILLFTIYRKRHRRRESENDEEGMAMVSGKRIEGKISYYELWCLVRELDDTALLRDTLCELRSADIKEELSDQEGYEILCKWKDDNDSGNGAEILNKTLKKIFKKKKEDYYRLKDVFRANREISSMKSYQHTLEHILWNISDPQKINKFLSELIPGRPTSVVNDSVHVDPRQSAMSELTEWSNRHLDLNHLVFLSLALEKAECTSAAKTFFLIEKLPDQLTSPIETKAVKEIVQKLTGRHCKRLMRGKISNDKLRSIIAENNEFLFDTNAMIADWLRKLGCGDYEKRRRFDDAVIKIGRFDLLDCFGTMSHRPFDVHFKEQLQSQKNLFDHETIYDDDIPQLVKLIKCLPLDKISEFNKKTGLSADKADNVLKEELKERRDNVLTRSTSRRASSQEFRSLRNEMTKHNENFGSILTDEEVEDVAVHVTSADKQQELLRSLGIEVGAQQKRSFVDHLKEWRKTQSKRHKESLRQIGFGDSTVTDEEIEDVALKVTSTDKQLELLRSLDIEVSDQQNRPFVDQLKEWRTNKTQGNCREAFYQSLRYIGFFDFTLTDMDKENDATQVMSTEIQAQSGKRKIDFGQLGRSLLNYANKFREFLRTDEKTNCRKFLQESLGVIGLRECIVSKSTKKFVYQVELSSIALNLLMEDVRPITEALAIDRNTVNSYIKPVSKRNGGTKRLVLELLRSSETTREDFCKTLRCIGFVDASRSVYFGYEPSLSELIYIVDCVGQGYMDRLLKHLDLAADDIEECRDSKGQIDKLQLMRRWKRQIRPVPFHYRLEIAAALRAAELNEIANSVLSGEHRQKIPNPDVIKDISCRLDDAMRNKQCKWLKEKYGLKEEEPTALMINWANTWMREYRPTGIQSRLAGYMEERKIMNDTLFNAGIPELAEEISALENSQLL